MMSEEGECEYAMNERGEPNVHTDKVQQVFSFRRLTGIQNTKVDLPIPRRREELFPFVMGVDKVKVAQVKR